MSFRLGTIFWVFALVASAIATFGPAGVVVAGLVFGFWAWRYYGPKLRSTVVNVLAIVAVVAVLLALLLPVVQSARQAARRNYCMNNLKNIALALHNYHDLHRSFPPAYIADASGKPMHSWRVLILPYLGQQGLYSKYRFNEPWDGPNNSKLAAQIPDAYRCPSQLLDPANQPAETHYFAIVDPEAAWLDGRGRRLRDFTDGTSRTILVIEASGLHAHWMEPGDVSLDEAIELLTTKPQSGHTHVSDQFFTTTYYETSYRNVAFSDGSVHWFGQFSDADVARAFLTAAGGEAIPQGVHRQDFRPDVTRTVVNWGNVYALSIFIILSLLPARWTIRSVVKEQADAIGVEVVAAGEPLARG